MNSHEAKRKLGAYTPSDAPAGARTQDFRVSQMKCILTVYQSSCIEWPKFCAAAIIGDLSTVNQVFFCQSASCVLDTCPFFACESDNSRFALAHATTKPQFDFTHEGRNQWA